MNDNSPTGTHGARIAVLLPSLEGGGAERSMLNLINGFLARGRAVDPVLCRAKGAYIGGFLQDTADRTTGVVACACHPVAEISGTSSCSCARCF
ncbi:MAG: hypothetical protein IPG06_25470 [Haliea sp.]|nr:hypothetical protein [Haliea sp.]